MRSSIHDNSWHLLGIYIFVIKISVDFCFDSFSFLKNWLNRDTNYDFRTAVPPYIGGVKRNVYLLAYIFFEEYKQLLINSSCNKGVCNLTRRTLKRTSARSHTVNGKTKFDD